MPAPISWAAARITAETGVPAAAPTKAERLFEARPDVRAAACHRSASC
jgi:hypothetical protein